MQWLIIGLSLAFLGVFLFVPLLVVFSETLRDVSLTVATGE